MPNENRVIYPGEFLLPAASSGLTEWACVACDQYTSQPRYWQEARLLAGSHPSTLNLILPECELDEAAARVPQIHQTMRDYLEQGVLVPAVRNGFVLTERNHLQRRARGPGGAAGFGMLRSRARQPQPGARHGGHHRKPRAAPHGGAAGAPLEVSHVLMLMDDPMHSVVEPCLKSTTG